MGLLSVKVSKPLSHSGIHGQPNLMPYLYIICDVPRTPWTQNSDKLFVREAIFHSYDKRKQAVTVQFQTGELLELPITSDRIAAQSLQPVIGHGDFVSLDTLAGHNGVIFNTVVDLRKYKEIVEEFDGVLTNAFAIEDPQLKKVTCIYAAQPRFVVGEIFDTDYIPSDAISITHHFGYARVMKVTTDTLRIGENLLSIPVYTIQRSYHGISIEDWSYQQKLFDTKIDGKQNMKKLPVNVQQQVALQFFDTFYRG